MDTAESAFSSFHPFAGMRPHGSAEPRTNTAQAFSVLHVIEALTGGPASYMREILPAQMSALGDENVALIIPREQATELPEAARLRVDFFKKRRFRALHLVTLGWRTRRFVMRHHPNVVHAQGTWAGISVRLALKGVSHAPRVVYCSHGWAFDRLTAPWKNRLIAWVERKLASQCDSIVCISQHDYRSALKTGIDRERLVEIRNAVSDEFKPSGKVDWPEGKRRFLFVGRFDRQKGVDLFFTAMRELGDDAFAYAIGSNVVNSSSELATPDNVRLTGWLPREEVMAYIASADVVVVPSRWEGFGLAALEAMRAGRPIIATKTGGLPELIRHGNTGLLVPPDDAASLVRAMQSLSALELQTMGDRAKLRFERMYRSDRLNQELLALYRELASRDQEPSEHVPG